MLKIKEDLSMHRILIVCDGKEFTFRSKHTQKEIFEFIRINKNMVSIKDDISGEEIFIDPNKVSIIKYITPEQREVVIPLESTMGLDKLTEGIAKKVSAIKETNITITLDSKEIGRAVLDQLRKMQRQGNITLNLV